MTYIEKLLNGAEVEWKPLGEIAILKNGKDWKNLKKGEIPVYGTGGIMEYVDTFAYDKPSVLIPRKGSITNIFYVETPFWNVDTIYYTEIDTKQIIPRFFFHFMKTLDLMKLDTGSGRPSLTQAILNQIQIPIPPIEVQEEIVRILDKFTELKAELETELEARQKQYEYYRDKLLTFSDLITPPHKILTISEIGEIRMCKRVMKNETMTIGDIPFYKIGTFGKKADAYISAELYEDYKRRYSFPKKGDILISASGTIGRTVIYDGKPAYFQDSNIVWVDNDESMVTNKFLNYIYQITEWQTDGGTIKRLYNNNLRKVKIPVPSIEEQKHIVSILDKFDTLTHSISEGLPREIELRQKQYEYYRDKLLNFSH